MSSAAQSAASFSKCSFIPDIWFSQTLHECTTSNNEGYLGLNFFWIFPLNALCNLVAIALTPLFALVNMIASLIFKLIACCASEANKAAWNEAARRNCVAARNSCTLGIGVMLLRILNPSYRGCPESRRTDPRVSPIEPRGGGSLPGGVPGGSPGTVVLYGGGGGYGSGTLDGVD